MVERNPSLPDILLSTDYCIKCTAEQNQSQREKGLETRYQIVLQYRWEKAFFRDKEVVYERPDKKKDENPSR